MIPATVATPAGLGGTSELAVVLFVIGVPLVIVVCGVFVVAREWLDERSVRQWSSRRPRNRKSSGQRRRTPPSTGTGTGTGRHDRYPRPKIN